MSWTHWQLQCTPQSQRITTRTSWSKNSTFCLTITNWFVSCAGTLKNWRLFKLLCLTSTGNQMSPFKIYDLLVLYCLISLWIRDDQVYKNNPLFLDELTDLGLEKTDAVILSCNCPWNALVPHWLQPWLLPSFVFNGQSKKRDTCKLICTKFIWFCQGPPLLGDHEEHRQHQDDERTCVRPRAGLQAQLQRGHQDCWPHQDAGLPRWSFQAKWIWGWSYL